MTRPAARGRFGAGGGPRGTGWGRHPGPSTLNSPQGGAQQRGVRDPPGYPYNGRRVACGALAFAGPCSGLGPTPVGVSSMAAARRGPFCPGLLPGVPLASAAKTCAPLGRQA